MAIEYDVTIGDYHGSETVSHTKLRDFARLGPRGYWLRHINAHAFHKRKTTTALQFGQAFDTLLTEGADAFEQAIATRPPEIKNFTTKAGKAWKLEALDAGKIILTLAQIDAVGWMHKAIVEEPVIALMLDACKTQPTITWDCPGLAGLKSRPDYLCLQDRRVFSVDLKTTATLDGFERSIAAYGYYNQAALVQQGLRAHGYADTEHYLLAVEKAFPHRARVYQLTQDYLDRGHLWVSTQCALLAQHLQEQRWPAIATPLVEVNAPEWLSDPSFTPLDEDEAAA